MKKNFLVVGLFVALLGITTAGVAGAQYGAGKGEKQKPAAEANKAAKPHTMTGCLEKGADETMFRLTNVEGTGPKTVELHADVSKKLSAHVGHKVSITGTDVDPKTMEKGTTGKPAAGAPATPSASEHHMRVNSLKMISATCPS